MDWGTEVQTLVAVVVGGVITFGATYWLERRREESVRKENEERLRADTRVAAMLVGYELLDAQAELIGASSLDKMPPRLSDELWRKWAPTLARGLSRDEWAQVARAFDRVTEVNRELRSSTETTRSTRCKNGITRSTSRRWRVPGRCSPRHRTYPIGTSCR
jgi:hypothetical protein